MKNVTFYLLAFFAINLSLAQTTVQGLITDGDTALPWVNVQIKRTKTGTTTDDFGRFTIEVQKGDTLIISHIGFETKEILIANQKTLIVALEGNVLDEVVVVAQNIEICKFTSTNCWISKYRTCCTSAGVSVEQVDPKEDTRNTSTTLFPNPSSNGVFQLQLFETYKNVEFFVNTMSGQQLLKKNVQFTGNSIPLDLASYPTGIYLINIIADGEPLPTQKAIRS